MGFDFDCPVQMWISPISVIPSRSTAIGFWLFHLFVAEHHLINNDWLIDFSLPVPSINPLPFFLPISSSHLLSKHAPFTFLSYTPWSLFSASSCYLRFSIFFFLSCLPFLPCLSILSVLHSTPWCSPFSPIISATTSVSCIWISSSPMSSRSAASFR